MIKCLVLLKILNMVDINVDFLEQFINFLIKKLVVVVFKDQQLAKELHKPIIRNFKKRKVHSSFIDNIWGADLVDNQLISKFDKGIRFLLCLIAIYSKYAWITPLKEKRN